MNDKVTYRWVFVAALFFLLLNTILITQEIYYGLAVPFLLALIGLAVLSLDKLLMFVVVATPFSIALEDPRFNVNVMLPTEPIMLGLLGLFVVRLLYKGSFDRQIFWHPLSIMIVVMTAWLGLTTLTSSMPLVSFKFLLSRLWLVTTYYYWIALLLKEKKSVKTYYWLYLLPLSAAVTYTLVMHAQKGFSHESSIGIMMPFYKEHTSYGAVLAMYFPPAVALAFFTKDGLNRKALGVVVTLILAAGLIFSYTRAAWVSLVVALGFVLLVKAGLRLKGFLVIIGFLVIGLVGFQDRIFNSLSENTQDSSDDLAEHVESISNISTDASNLERINRWKSAYRMFLERPVVGWGPGTYMFQYAPFQSPREKTIISTNNGDVGNAHSEYIGPLAEQGLVGALLVLALVFMILKYGLKVYDQTTGDTRVVAMAALLGLITYFTHGFLNNFLEMDKAACPVWGFLAVLTILDLHSAPKQEE